MDVEKRRSRLRKIMMRICTISWLRMREVKLKLNPSKWVFKTQKVIFMGFQLSPEEMA